MPIIPYRRSLAVQYARRWALSRNPAYYNFDDLGGDCTNFASQCIYAGSGVMNYTPIYGWYYITANDRTASWTGVEYLYRFLVGNEGAGPFGRVTQLQNIRPGDIVQLSFDGETFGHSPVVVSVGNRPDPDNILIAAHTYDALDRPLSTYSYQELRPITILGVRI